MEHFSKRQRDRLCLLVAALMILISAELILNPFSRVYNENTGILRIGVFSDSLWGEKNGYAHVILNKAIKEFEDLNPGVSVVYESGILRQDYSEWLSNEILKSTAPDVFFVLDEDFEYLSDVGALEDLTSYALSDKSFDPGVYYDAPYNAGKRKGIQYALPYECSPEIMVVNVSILEAENIAMPDSDWTWEECFNICRQVTGPRNNESGYQFGISEYGWESCFCSNGVTLFSDEGEQCYLTDERVTEAINFLDRLGRLTAKMTNVQPSFSDGNVLFQPMSYSAYNAYISNPIHMGVGGDFTWEIHTMPQGPKGDNTSNLNTQLLAMNSHSSKKGLAWKLMKTLTSDPDIQTEIYRYSEGISVCRQITHTPKDEFGEEKPNKNDQKILAMAMEHSANRQRFRNKEEAFQQIDIAVSDILAGSGNIRMEQIIYNRKINNFLQQMT